MSPETELLLWTIICRVLPILSLGLAVGVLCYIATN
jgi:hypothetical protein